MYIGVYVYEYDSFMCVHTCVNIAFVCTYDYVQRCEDTVRSTLYVE